MAGKYTPIISLSKVGLIDFMPNVKELELLPLVNMVSPDNFGSLGAKIDIEGNGFRPDI